MPEAATRVAIVGAADFGQSLRRQMADHPDLQFVGFFDDTAPPGPSILGPIDEALSDTNRARCDQLIMGIGYHHLQFRKSLFQRFQQQGIRWTTMIHPSATVAPCTEIGEGVIVSAGCVLDVGVKIGVNTLINVGCVIAHDSTVGPHTFLGPSVNVAGFVTIGERCFVGIGTTVIDNQQLGDGCQTGAGAVVISPVRPHELVAGVPASVRKTLDF